MTLSTLVLVFAATQCISYLFILIILKRNLPRNNLFYCGELYWPLTDVHVVMAIYIYKYICIFLLNNY